MVKRHNSIWRRFGLVFPALTWLVVQFAMASGLQAAPASGVLIELCTAYENARVLIDLETGEPVEQSQPAHGCDWCHSFGKAVVVPRGLGFDWRAVAFYAAGRMVPSPPSHVVLRLVGDALTRAPPVG
ncbi:hypothetical protein [Microbulbifer sp. S227A]|uniref:hypothetical protein n=1 Tax=Microbulbifer sp. S227A TaxID=3415131 RepID=UPI003C7E49B7